MFICDDVAQYFRSLLFLWIPINKSDAVILTFIFLIIFSVITFYLNSKNADDQGE